MTPRIKLSLSHLQSIISENKYKVDEKNRFIARCIDGRYENSPQLPALTIPGADIGDLAILYATANQYAFEVDHEKALSSLQKLVGENEVQRHIDDHTNPSEFGCAYLKQLHIDPAAYSLEKADVTALENQIQKYHEKGEKEIVLKGNHEEVAVLFIRGGFGVLPQYTLHTDTGLQRVQLFIFQQTLLNARHRAWAEVLVTSGAVKLFDNLDDEYLYEVLSSTTDDHLFETLKRLAKDLPIFQVVFSEDGSCEIKQDGFV